MNKLKSFLQIEVRRSYKQIVKAAAISDIIEVCFDKLKFDDKTIINKLTTLQTMLNNCLSEIERYLDIS